MAASTHLSPARILTFARLSLHLRPDPKWKPASFSRNWGRRTVYRQAPRFTSILSLGSHLYSRNMSTSGGPFHEAALRGDLNEFESLANSGVDVNALDLYGRLPLHTFCGSSWMHDEFLLDGQVPRPATEWLLRHTNDIDTPDKEGITALHIASMMSQYLVKKLLAAGADPKRTTCDGMTALHLAARARQSNIVGMLTEDANQDGEFRRGLINAKDKVGRTPLHYACRSGRPETVSYLLAAGANPTSLDVDGLTPLDACLEFEEEQALWADYREFEPPDWYYIHLNNPPSDWGVYAVGGLRRQDDGRPWTRPSRDLQHTLDRFLGEPWGEDSFRVASAQHTARLGESVDAIVKAMIDQGEGTQAVQDRIAKCVEHCEIKGLEYTKSCLAGLRVQSAATDNDVEECIQSSQLDLVKRYGKRNDQPNNYVHVALVDLLLRRRRYDELERILRHDGSFRPLLKSDVFDIARLLVKNGFAKLLGVLLDSKYGAQVCAEASTSSSSADPLLIIAVKRQLPNIDVVRLLVERAQVDLNARSRTGEEAYADIDAPGVCYNHDVAEPGLNTALHECAKGFNWWQVKWCLPYLLHYGSDPHLENEAGETPYQLTQAEYKETFMDDAARLLKPISRTS